MKDLECRAGLCGMVVVFLCFVCAPADLVPGLPLHLIFYGPPPGTHSPPLPLAQWFPYRSMQHLVAWTCLCAGRGQAMSTFSS